MLLSNRLAVVDVHMIEVQTLLGMCHFGGSLSREALLCAPGSDG